MESKKTPREYVRTVKVIIIEQSYSQTKPILSVKTAGKSRYQQAHYKLLAEICWDDIFSLSSASFL